MNRIKLFLLTLCLGLGALQLAHAQRYQVGDQARSFDLKSTTGEMVSPDDYPDAQGFIVVFTCNTCPWAQAYEQRINELSQQFAEQGFPVLAINPNDPGRSPGDAYSAMVERAREKGYHFPYLMDETQEVAKAYGATKTPEVFLLVKEDGKLRVAYVGAIDDSPRDAAQADKKYVEEVIEALKAGKKPPYEEIKAIGCSVKYRS